MSVSALPELRQVLARLHFRVTLFAVAIAGLSVLVLGVAVMSRYAHRNLELIAQLASYNAEPALVFADRKVLAASIAPLGDTEGVQALLVFDEKGRLLSERRRPEAGWMSGIEQWGGRRLLGSPVVVPVRHDGQMIGEIRVYGDLGGIGHYLAVGTAGTLLCLLIAMALTRLLAERLRENVVRPLDAIATVAHQVRTKRSLDLRAPSAPIAEIQSLGEDFNALLSELQSWHGDLKEENQTLAYRATHDALTGLANRNLLIERIDAAIRSAAASGTELAVLYLDANRFKAINDQFGHAAGDALLVEIARRIRNILRRGDMAARLGGDEFAILVGTPADAFDAAAVAGRLHEAMTKPVTLPDGRNTSSTLSVGIAVYPRDGVDSGSLLSRADEAMYAAKQGVADITQGARS